MTIEKKDVLDFFQFHDEHVATLLDWIRSLDDLILKVRRSERDVEIQQELFEIQKRLVNEVGIRVSMMFE